MKRKVERTCYNCRYYSETGRCSIMAGVTCPHSKHYVKNYDSWELKPRAKGVQGRKGK